MSDERIQGRVKWWNDAKGYGFIAANNGVDFFAHYNEIEGVGHRSLAEGQIVEFRPGQSEKGPRALVIKPV